MNYRKQPLWIKILIGMVAGMIMGLIIGQHASLFEPIGQLFISAIRMVVVPLVFCSLVAGITSMADIRKMGRISVKTICLYLLTSICAVLIGLLLVYLIKPGLGVSIPSSSLANTGNSPFEGFSIASDGVGSFIQILWTAFWNILLEIIPANPVAALASNNFLQIIFFAVVLGVTITLIGRKGKVLVNLFNAGAHTMYKLTSLVMQAAPFGVFALMAGLVGTYGIASLLSLILIVITIYLGYVLLALSVYIPLIWFMTGLSPRLFFKHVFDALLVAFTTSSSAAALPVSMSCAQKNLGVSKNITSFILPLGSTINMNGAALFFGVAAVAIAQVYGIDLSFHQYALIMVMAIAASIGSAGVPSAGIVLLPMVLNTVGLPLEGIVLIVAIDRIIDMGRTSFNVLGDLICALVIANSEGELKRDVFNQKAKQRKKIKGMGISTPSA